MDDPRDLLRTAIESGDTPFDVGRVALALAAFDRAAIPLDRYLDHLDELADDARREISGPDVDSGDVHARLAALRAAIVDRHHYRGDTLTYDDLQNANLMRVIDRRKGLPVTLGILYMATGVRLGWPVAGLNFPGHFLIRIEGTDGGRIIADPFNDGREVGAPQLRELLKTAMGADAELEAGHYATVEPVDVLLRLQNNVKLRRVRAGDVAGALDTVETMMIVAPDRAELMREAGLMNAHLERYAAATEWLGRYVAVETEPGARHRAAALLQELRTRLS